jgi:acetyltransferase-like isoleucine patch superfamily enzyme
MTHHPSPPRKRRPAPARVLRNRFSTVLHSLRRWCLGLEGVEFAGSAIVRASVEARCGFLRRHGVISFGDRVELSRGCLFHAHGGSIITQENVYFGPYCVLYGHGGIRIGAHTLLGPGCTVISSNHEIPPRGTLIRSRPDTLLPVDIGDDVWMGARVTVLGGVTIGRGAVIGAGAVVTRDIPEYSIARGVPARVSGERV